MAHLLFKWTVPTTYADGSPLSEELTYNLYEDGSKIVGDILEPHFSLTMNEKAEGTYSYSVTAVSTNFGLESKQSPAVSVNFISPKFPTDLSYSYSE